MAFVFKSERITLINQNPDSNLGPGYYLNPDPHIVRPQSSKAPFLTSTKRRTDFNMNNEIPGPGTYDLKENRIQSVLTKPPNLIKNLDEENVISLDPLGFSVKNRRWNNEIKVETPGPGHYNKELGIFRNVKSSKGRKTNFPQNLTMKKNNNPNISIPSKNNCFGFEQKPDGHIGLADDPHKLIKYQGTKDDCVGPGTYNVSEKPFWEKKGNSWSKMKSQRAFSATVKEVNLVGPGTYQLTQDKNWFRAGSAWSKMKTKRRLDNKKLDQSFDSQTKDTSQLDTKSKLRRYVKEKSKLRRKLISESSKRPTLENIIKKETPGPGYYDSSKMFNTANIVNQKKPENYQYFGSATERFPENLNGNEGIGPGTYFHPKKPKSQKTKAKAISFGTNSKREISSAKEKANEPGPAEYNPKKMNSGLNHTYKMIFSSKNKRFQEPKKEPIENLNKNQFEVDKNFNIFEFDSNKVKYKFSAPFKTTKREGNNLLFNEKDEVPPLGWYNPDYAYNLSYKVGKKAFRPSLVNVAFNSLQKRFDEKLLLKNQTKVGPGQYTKDFDLINEPKTNKNAPFIYREKRFNSIKEEKDPKPPVGSYDLNGSFDWHKKTFNVNFL